MLSYREYEKKVFDWLSNKHSKNREFTFSVRKVASPGARTDYFIGTEKSKYFQTTFWDIRVAFPGSSGDLINVVFDFASNGYRFKFEFNQTKSPHNEQNKLALELIRLASEEIQNINPEKFYTSPDENKMEYFKLQSQKSSYSNLEEMFFDLDKYLPKVIQIVDKHIADIKNQNPEFIAERITPESFDTNLEKMRARFEKHKNIEPDEPKIDATEEGEGEMSEKFEIHPNQILYGPPGTGKTYHTVNYALSIIENDERYIHDEKLDREKLRSKFKKYKNDQQIRFVTFHPSFTYEDFVEGIKPKLYEETEDDEIMGDVQYEMVDGIFKQICDSAIAAQDIAKQKKEGFRIPEELTRSERVHKISLGNSSNPEDDKIYEYCISEGLLSIGFLWDIDCSNANTKEEIYRLATENGYEPNEFGVEALHRFKNWMKDGDIVFVSYGTTKLRAIGIIRDKQGDGYFYDTERPGYNHFRHVEWILVDKMIPIKDVYYARFSHQTIYMMHQDRINWDYFRIEEDAHEVEKKFVLIIDEINRGNIPSIFGELITLIEPDKRSGGTENISVNLPYSKENFSVPSNVYLIGTMNTADRSVEALDVALRRRFEFRPYFPEPKKIIQPDNFDIDLPQLLDTINDRIEYLLDKDHTIGHSYFMDLHKAKNPGSELKNIFKNKVIPLLEEYFYGQIQNIGLVLGGDFVTTKHSESSSSTIFPKNFTSQDPPVERVIYEVKDPTKFGDLIPFINIYE